MESVYKWTGRVVVWGFLALAASGGVAGWLAYDRLDALEAHVNWLHQAVTQIGSFLSNGEAH